jgi:hypothetical protein
MPKFEPEYSVETPGLIADPIKSYLESTEKRMHKDVLDETVQRMRHVIVRDLMQPRDTRVGKESCTLYSGPCARKSRLTYDGAVRDALKARTVLKFLLGDLVELSVLAVARLAGCHITDNNIDLTVTGHDGVSVPVHPDGFYQAADGKQYNVEIKSCDSRTFDAWLANGGPDDEWWYRTQASMEVQAWREHGRDVNATIFIGVSTGSRQGSIAEWIVPFDNNLVLGWHERRGQAQCVKPPDIPFGGEPEIQFMRGKEADAEWFVHGEPTPRINEKGSTYGWDVLTGRTILPIVCTYCDFRSAHCWPEAVMEMNGVKPIWVVPEKVKI